MSSIQAYRKVIAHRQKCKKWENNEKCLECFGGGLTEYTEALLKEMGMSHLEFISRLDLAQAIREGKKIKAGTWVDALQLERMKRVIKP